LSVFQKLMDVREAHGAGFFVLLDPDHSDKEDLVRAAATFEECGADAILVGGSFLVSTEFDRMVRLIKHTVQVPVIIFGAGSNQISSSADAIFFLSMISGRNPELLIGQHVRAAPVLKAYGLEPISTGYILVDSGRQTTVEYISNTKPVPRDKPDIAMAHALAAEYLGMQCVYLDAGSGAEKMVPEEMIQAVRDYISIPRIVGGGIRRPEDAASKVAAGASFVVIGSVLEDQREASLALAFAEAIHSAS